MPSEAFERTICHCNAVACATAASSASASASAVSKGIRTGFFSYSKNLINDGSELYNKWS